MDASILIYGMFEEFIKSSEDVMQLMLFDNMGAVVCAAKRDNIDDSSIDYNGIATLTNFFYLNTNGKETLGFCLSEFQKFKLVLKSITNEYTIALATEKIVSNKKIRVIVDNLINQIKSSVFFN